MTPKQQVKKFLKKLESPYWTPYPTSMYLTNWQGNIPTFNMYYVLRGRPSRSQPGDVERNMGYWKCAKAIVETAAISGSIGDTVVVLSPSDFWSTIIKIHPTVFTKFLPLADWQRLMNENVQDSQPAAINASFLAFNLKE